MLERIYQRCSRQIALLVLLTLPVVSMLAMRLNPANDIETWMPESDPARICYDEFRSLFGAEEFVLIAFDRERSGAPDSALIEAICTKLERLPEIRQCWSPDRMTSIMHSLRVEPDDAARRIQGLLTSREGGLCAVVAVLSEAGARNRTAAVDHLRHELKYCLVDGDNSLLAGKPMFVSELDRLGGKEANAGYFTITLGICLALLYYLIREWKLTGLVFLLTLWTINATIVLLHLVAVEVNLLLSSIPVLVMVLTMSISVHYLYYYREALDRSVANPVVAGLRTAWWPTLIATVTTCIGELALSVSDIAPIRQFAYAASLGSVLSMIAGLGITPALVVICPTLPRRLQHGETKYAGLAAFVAARSRPIAALTLIATGAACFGLVRLRADVTVADYLPRDSKVRRDFLRVERELTGVDSIETVVRFDDGDSPFVARLERVQRIEDVIRRHPAVVQTMSLADFFPDPLPQEPLALLSILKSALNQRANNEYAAEGETVWRISARVRVGRDHSWQSICSDLKAALRDEPVTFTGMSVLVDGAQREIFNSFWQSILVALVLITVAIMVFLKSIRLGITAMIPNLAPLIWIYGLLGWLDQPIDIAMMLSGSIALGLSVDGTFHFMSHFRMHLRQSGSPDLATRQALLESSIPFAQATLTATAGMLGLTLSSFAPTAHFGWLMISLMLAALVGDVVMLPALVRIVCGATRQRTTRVPPAMHSATLDRAA